jgi:hypothetical protein
LLYGVQYLFEKAKKWSWFKNLSRTM